MKRFAILLSILILAFVMAACGNHAQAKKLQNAKVLVSVQQHMVLGQK